MVRPTPRGDGSFRFEDMMTLSPSEYTGETGTCVCGRVVLSRGPFKIETRARADSSASGQKGQIKKGKKK